jgi:hypothetical protein
MSDDKQAGRYAATRWFLLSLLILAIIAGLPE